MNPLSKEAIDTLRKSPHYRDFLGAWFEYQEISYASFSRKAGFSSRSFPRDVITGKRRLSAKAFVKFQSALALPPRWRKFFRLLVVQAEPDLFGHADPTRIRAELTALREDLKTTRDRKPRTPAPREADKILSIPHILPIFAALGDPENGATLEEIRERTALDDSALKKSLASMVRLGLASFDETRGRYHPQSFHLSLSEAGRSRVFHGLFERALEASRRRAGVAFDSDSELFFTSTFCVSESQLPRLKNELREVLLRYVDQSSQAHGNQVITLVTGLNRI